MQKHVSFQSINSYLNMQMKGQQYNFALRKSVRLICHVLSVPQQFLDRDAILSTSANPTQRAK